MFWKTVYYLARKFKHFLKFAYFKSLLQMAAYQKNPE